MSSRSAAAQPFKNDASGFRPNTSAASPAQKQIKSHAAAFMHSGRKIASDASNPNAPTPFFTSAAPETMTENASENALPTMGIAPETSIFAALPPAISALFATIVCTDKMPVYTVTASTKAHLITLYSASVSRFKSNDVTAEATENAKNTRKTGMSTALLKTETAFAAASDSAP